MALPGCKGSAAGVIMDVLRSTSCHSVDNAVISGINRHRSARATLVRTVRSRRSWLAHLCSQPHLWQVASAGLVFAPGSIFATMLLCQLALLYCLNSSGFADLRSVAELQLRLTRSAAGRLLFEDFRAGRN